VFLSLWRAGLLAAPGRTTLALEVGLGLPFGAAGPLDYLAGSSATVGAGLRELQGSLELAAPDVRLELEELGRGAVEVAIVNAPPFEGSWWSDEFICGLLVSPHRRPAAATRVGVLRADFARPRPPNAERWAALLGCAVRFGRPRTALRIPRAVFSLPLDTADQHLASAMRALLGMRRERAPALAPALRAHLKARLEGRRHSAQSSARALGVSLRTLQRQLMDQGLSFRGVLDEVRMERAELLLADTPSRVSEVAQELGFAEQASFTRAFRRWTGMTPQAWRRACTPAPSERRARRPRWRGLRAEGVGRRAQGPRAPAPRLDPC